MNESTRQLPQAVPADPALAEQARRGRGVTSQAVRLHIEDPGGSGRPVVPIHGGSDAIVPFEGSGQRTHRAVPHRQLVKVNGAPHGFNLSHAPAFNDAVLTFLQN